MKLIHLTDTHLVAEAADLYGTNPKKRLEQAVAHIAQRHPDAHACVVTGDLTHYGHADAYTHLRDVLAGLPMPVHLIPGNHDSRATLLEHFPDTPVNSAGFIQYDADLGDYRAIFLDTNEPGVHWGVLCESRADWLREQLRATLKPLLLFMHHPFFPVGIGSMDNISLRDTRPLLSAIDGFESRIAHVFFGHIHRPIFGSFRGIPFSTLRGTNHQVALDLRQGETIQGSQEPPQYGVVLLSREQITIHLEDYLDDSPRFPLGG